MLATSTGSYTETIGGIIPVEKDEGKSFWSPDYLRRYHAMATRLKCFKDLNKQIYSQVIPNPNAEVLELGCGSGRNIPLIIKSMGLDKGNGRIHAIDFNYSSLKLANEYLGNPPNVFFKEGNMRQLDFDSNIFDSIFDIFAGTYLPHKGWIQGIKEAFRVMKPGGHGHFLYFVHGKKFSHCFRSQVPIELVHNPVGFYWAFHLKLIRGMNVWDKFIEKGDVVYPKFDEFTSIIDANGAVVEIAQKAFLGTCIFVRAKKH